MDTKVFVFVYFFYFCVSLNGQKKVKDIQAGNSFLRPKKTTTTQHKMNRYDDDNDPFR